jgi:hypothetical protein
MNWEGFLRYSRGLVQVLCCDLPPRSEEIREEPSVKVQSNPLKTTLVYTHLLYSVRYSVVTINSSLLTITLFSSVLRKLVYNDKIFSPFHEVITEFDCSWCAGWDSSGGYPEHKSTAPPLHQTPRH